jgi:hypothetical protein|tara:strand:- start:1760 stop:1963 length:204 start_codon:yes stop_codon:yes gene_type:complete
MKLFLKSLTHPGMLIFLMMSGTITFIGIVHNDAHLRMTIDADAYARKWCRSSAENKKTCIRYGGDMD